MANPKPASVCGAKEGLKLPASAHGRSLTGENTYKSLKSTCPASPADPGIRGGRAAVPEKSYRNPEIDENLQVRLASYLQVGLSYRMFLIGTQAVRDPKVRKLSEVP